MRLKVLGAIIAGGRSRRFGSDKAEALFGGVKLIEHVIAGMAPQSHSLVICGRSMSGYECLKDRPREGLGPLGGLAAALQHARAKGFDAVLTSACDTPLVPSNLAERLAGMEPAIVVGQPLFGCWPSSLSVDLDEFLSCGCGRAMKDWALWTGARPVRLTATIANINTMDDLADLRSASAVL
jgi:molybdopterin-guanine dinucleotide biosynthesis protein A